MSASALSVSSDPILTRGYRWGTAIVLTGLLISWGLWTWGHRMGATTNEDFVSFIGIVTVLFGTAVALGCFRSRLSVQDLPWQSVQGEVVRVERAGHGDGQHVYVRVLATQWPIVGAPACLPLSEENPPALIMVARRLYVPERPRGQPTEGQPMAVDVAWSRWDKEPQMRVPLAHKAIAGQVPLTKRVIGQMIRKGQWDSYDESAPSRRREHPAPPEPLIGPQASFNHVLIGGAALALGLTVAVLWGMVWAWSGIVHTHGPANLGLVLLGMGLPLIPLSLCLWGLFSVLDNHALAWQASQGSVVRNSFTPGRHGAKYIIDPFANLTLRFSDAQVPAGMKKDGWTQTDPPAVIVRATELRVQHVFVGGDLGEPIYKVGSLMPVAVALTRWSKRLRVRVPCASFGNFMPADDVPINKRVIAQPWTAQEWATYQAARDS